MGLGVDKKQNKNKNDLKKIKKRKINVSRPLFPKKRKKNVFASFQMRRREKKIQLTSDSGYWFFVNTSFFVIYSTIQAAKVLIAVCHFFLYKFPHLAYIWM